MRKSHIVGALIVTVVSLVFASPASAGTTCVGTQETAPDGRLRLGSGLFEGAGEYPITAISSDFLPVGQFASFTLHFRNESLSTRTVRVDREVLSLDGFASRYFVNGVNETQRVKAGRLAFRSMPPSAWGTLIVTVRNKSATESDQGLQLLRGRYKGSDPNACDALGPWVNNVG